LDQRRYRMEVQNRVPPLQNAYRVIAMSLDAVGSVFVKPLGLGGDAERAVVHMATGAAGDLTDLIGAEGAYADAIKLVERGEGDVIDVHIEAHSDSICRNEKVHVARLVEPDLSIAGPWTERAKHDGGASALPANKFRNSVNIFRREPDNGGAAR